MMLDKLEQKKVRWRCNRGMLELDLFLIPFAENHFNVLTRHEKDQFIQLLENEDPTLFGWFMGHELAPEDMQPIISKVKQALQRA